MRGRQGWPPSTLVCGATPKRPGWASSLGRGGDPSTLGGFVLGRGVSWWPQPGLLSLARQPLQLLACGSHACLGGAARSSWHTGLSVIAVWPAGTFSVDKHGSQAFR